MAGKVEDNAGCDCIDELIGEGVAIDNVNGCGCREWEDDEGHKHRCCMMLRHNDTTTLHDYYQPPQPHYTTTPANRNTCKADNVKNRMMVSIKAATRWNNCTSSNDSCGMNTDTDNQLTSQ